MAKPIVMSKQAYTAMQRMPQKDSDRIMQKLRQYALDPAAMTNNVKRLQGSHFWRLRVGDWRVVFDDTGTIVDVVEIALRGEVYRGF